MLSGAVFFFLIECPRALIENIKICDSLRMRVRKSISPKEGGRVLKISHLIWGRLRIPNNFDMAMLWIYLLYWLLLQYNLCVQIYYNLMFIILYAWLYVITSGKLMLLSDFQTKTLLYINTIQFIWPRLWIKYHMECRTTFFFIYLYGADGCSWHADGYYIFLFPFLLLFFLFSTAIDILYYYPTPPAPIRIGR